MIGDEQQAIVLTAITRRPSFQPTGNSTTLVEAKISTWCPPPTRSSTYIRIPMYLGKAATHSPGGAYLRIETAIRLSSGLTAKTAWSEAPAGIDVTDPLLPFASRKRTSVLLFK